MPFTVGNWVTPPDPQFIPGDANNDGLVGIADVTTITDYILHGDSVEINLLAADMDGDGIIGIADATLIIDMILQ